MNPVRIEFLKGERVINHFDRHVANYGDKKAAEALAAEIAADSGIEHDGRRIVWERKCEIKLFVDKKIEGQEKPKQELFTFLHTSAFDEAHALNKRLVDWLDDAKIDPNQIASTSVRFLE
jgi:hypothetical protein